jgi:hypothetical protein
VNILSRTLIECAQSSFLCSLTSSGALATFPEKEKAKNWNLKNLLFLNIYYTAPHMVEKKIKQ